MSAHTGDLGARIAALPGADRLLPALTGLSPAYLVGGALRDLLRGEESVDLDVAVEGDAPATARELAERLDGEAVEHERFGTATVSVEGMTVDLATTRRERYARPGALPEVEPATLVEDLARRDFTVNAMAAALAPVELGRLHDPHGGVPDLAAKVVRVLHYRSFVDDPTRLLRAVRYEVRLGFAMDAETEELAREAASGGALATVSHTRLGHELLALLAESDPAAGAERLRMLGLDRGLHPALTIEPSLVAGAALGAVEVGADRVLAALAALVAPAPTDSSPWVADLGLDRDRRERVLRAARRGPELAAELGHEMPASELHERLSREPPEALAVALGAGAPGEPILRYQADLRPVRLEITGEDLRDHGIPQSPAIGRALAATLRRKLDGEVAGRDEELRTAIELARGREA